jgi:hypothetical protein
VLGIYDEKEKKEGNQCGFKKVNKVESHRDRG